MRGRLYLITVLMLLGLVLSACGDESTPVNQNKDLPKDRMLYLGNGDGWPDLYSVDFSGKITGRLTESAEAEFGASWSPDGRKIVYTALNGDQPAGDYSKSQQIIVMDGDGKNRKVVAVDGFNPQWSPDSSRILFVRTSPDTTPEPTLNPAEPTPTAIASRFSRVTTSATNDQKLKAALYLAPTDGSASGKNAGTLLADNAVYGVWSPDGKRIAYIAGTNDIDKMRSLFVVNADGSNRVNLTDKIKFNGQDFLYVSWSPDGVNLAFTAIDYQRDKAAVWKVSPEGNTPRRLGDYNGSGREITSLVWAYADYFNPAPRLRLAPVWSPNNRSVAFADASPRINVSEAETGNSRFFPVGNSALGQDKDAVMSVSWLSDSRRVVYDRSAAGRNGLLLQPNNYIFDWTDETLEIMDISTKSTTTIANPPGGYMWTGCCGMDLLGGGAAAKTQPTTAPKTAPALPNIGGSFPEGKLVMVSGLGSRTLAVSELETGNRTIITSGAFRGLDVSVSPKGNSLVYLEVGDQYNSTLYLVGMDGKNRRKLSEGIGEPEDLSTAVKWSLDGRQVAFQALGNDPNLKGGLYAITAEPTGTEPATPRLITAENASGFDWSPDGTKLVYRLDRGQYELYVAEASNPEGTTKLLASVGAVNRNFSALGRGLLWSPDGKNIVVAGTGQFSRYVTWLVALDGTIREVPSSSAVGKLSGWSADGSKLVATTANYNQTSDVQILNTATASWRAYGPGAGPQLESSGQYVAVFSRFDATRYGSTPSNTLSRMTIIQLNNGQQYDTELTMPPYYAFKARFFDWSPTAKILAYYENNTIWAVGTDAKNPKAIGRAIGVERLIWVK